MRSTIDDAGRVVIPREILETTGLAGGGPVDVRERDGRIEIEAAPTKMKLVRRRAGCAAAPDERLPTLTDDMVRELLERLRR